MDPTNLQMLIELAAASRDGAAAYLAQTQQNLAQAHSQRAALQGYAHEYANRARRHSQQGIDPAAQANWRAFDGKLDDALVQQTREVERREAQVHVAEREFMDMQRRLKSLEALAARRHESIRQTTARREQKHTDEIAARIAAHALARLTEHPAPALRW